MDKKYFKKLFLFEIALIILAVYVALGLFLKESVFFSYDMPRDALIIQRFLAGGTYLTSQNYYAIGSWLNVSWGPAYIFYYSIFLTISSNPLIVANLLTLINIVAPKYRSIAIGKKSVIGEGW